MIESVYIHIPFCNNICSYCDFCKLFYKEQLVDNYLISLKQEINNIYKGDRIKTIYIGGGTPSSLSIEQLTKLFDILKIFNLDKNYEFTIECNFDSVNIEKLNLFKNNGINRISFGLESTIKKNLKLLERDFSKDKVIYIINQCKTMNLNNINIDLMYAIPNENMEDLKNDIDFILSLDVPHISTYSLILEEHTKLFLSKTDYISEDLDFKMYDFICNKLKTKYIHYEISNFSKEGYESKHNLCYWMNREYYGFGLGASSYINSKRINNTRSITNYLKNKIIYNFEKLNISDKMSYEMILGLRTKKGINKKLFYNKYKHDIKDVFNINELIENKLLIDNGEQIYIPEDKWYISNEILINFIEE